MEHLVVEHNIEYRAMHMDLAVVFDEGQLTELIHEETGFPGGLIVQAHRKLH